MRSMRHSFLVFVAVILLAACSSKPADQSSNASEASSSQAATESAAKSGDKAAPKGGAAKGSEAAKTPAVAEIPAGHAITVRLGQAVGSKISNSGDSFSATVAQPVEVNGQVVIPQGATASGTVAEAAPLGRFKGGARLRVILNSINVNGKDYKIETAAAGFAQKGKGKRTAGFIGGGAGLGALVGGLAGGGKGALIGAAAGAGAGTAGAAFTGNKNIVLPAESAVTFKLLQPVQIQQ